MLTGYLHTFLGEMSLQNLPFLFYFILPFLNCVICLLLLSCTKSQTFCSSYCLVAKLYLTLRPQGLQQARLPILHYLLEFVQIQVH